MLNEFKNNPTVISITSSGNVHTTTLAGDANMYDMLQGFYGLCVASGWNPETVIKGMYEFVEQTDIYGWTPVNDIENSPENRD